MGNESPAPEGEVEGQPNNEEQPLLHKEEQIFVDEECDGEDGEKGDQLDESEDVPTADSCCTCCGVLQACCGMTAAGTTLIRLSFVTLTAVLSNLAIGALFCIVTNTKKDDKHEYLNWSSKSMFALLTIYAFTAHVVVLFYSSPFCCRGSGIRLEILTEGVAWAWHNVAAQIYGNYALEPKLTNMENADLGSTAAIFLTISILAIISIYAAYLCCNIKGEVHENAIEFQLLSVTIAAGWSLFEFMKCLLGADRDAAQLSVEELLVDTVLIIAICVVMLALSIRSADWEGEWANAFSEGLIRMASICSGFAASELGHKVITFITQYGEYTVVGNIIYGVVVTFICLMVDQRYQAQLQGGKMWRWRQCDWEFVDSVEDEVALLSQTQYLEEDEEAQLIASRRLERLLRKRLKAKMMTLMVRLVIAWAWQGVITQTLRQFMDSLWGRLFLYGVATLLCALVVGQIHNCTESGYCLNDNDTTDFPEILKEDSDDELFPDYQPPEDAEVDWSPRSPSRGVTPISPRRPPPFLPFTPTNTPAPTIRPTSPTLRAPTSRPTSPTSQSGNLPPHCPSSPVKMAYEG